MSHETSSKAHMLLTRLSVDASTAPAKKRPKSAKPKNARTGVSGTATIKTMKMTICSYETCRGKSLHRICLLCGYVHGSLHAYVQAETKKGVSQRPNPRCKRGTGCARRLHRHLIRSLASHF